MEGQGIPNPFSNRQFLEPVCPLPTNPQRKSGIYSDELSTSTPSFSSKIGRSKHRFQIPPFKPPANESDSDEEDETSVPKDDSSGPSIGWSEEDDDEGRSSPLLNLDEKSSTALNTRRFTVKRPNSSRRMSSGSKLIPASRSFGPSEGKNRDRVQFTRTTSDPHLEERVLQVNSEEEENSDDDTFKGSDTDTENKSKEVTPRSRSRSSTLNSSEKLKEFVNHIYEIWREKEKTPRKVKGNLKYFYKKDLNQYALVLTRLPNKLRWTNQTKNNSQVNRKSKEALNYIISAFHTAHDNGINQASFAIKDIIIPDKEMDEDSIPSKSSTDKCGIAFLLGEILAYFRFENVLKTSSKMEKLAIETFSTIHLKELYSDVKMIQKFCKRIDFEDSFSNILKVILQHQQKIIAELPVRDELKESDRYDRLFQLLYIDGSCRGLPTEARKELYDSIIKNPQAYYVVSETTITKFTDFWNAIQVAFAKFISLLKAKKLQIKEYYAKEEGKKPNKKKRVLFNLGDYNAYFNRMGSISRHKLSLISVLKFMHRQLTQIINDRLQFFEDFLNESNRKEFPHIPHEPKELSLFITKIREEMREISENLQTDIFIPASGEKPNYKSINWNHLPFSFLRLSQILQTIFLEGSEKKSILKKLKRKRSGNKEKIAK